MIRFVDQRRSIIRGLPTADKPTAVVDGDPMTNQPRLWTSVLTRRAAKTRPVVIGRLVAGMRGLNARKYNALRFKRPEFCDFAEHRSPPLPRRAAGR